MKITCSKCDKKKPASNAYFTPRKSKRGFMSHCRECTRRKDRSRKRIREPAASTKLRRELAARGMRRCSMCGPQPIANFPPQYGTKYLSSRCQACCREIAKARMQRMRATPGLAEIAAAQTQRYRQSPKGRATKRVSAAVHNHRRRSRAQGLPFHWTRLDWVRCKTAWSHQCAYCNKRPDKLTQDHFIPLTHAACPGTIPTNMVPACRRCNTQKHNNDPAIWCSPASLQKIYDYFETLRNAA